MLAARYSATGGAPVARDFSPTTAVSLALVDRTTYTPFCVTDLGRSNVLIALPSAACTSLAVLFNATLVANGICLRCTSFSQRVASLMSALTLISIMPPS